MSLARFDANRMARLDNVHGVGFTRAVEGEDFLSALEALALLTTCSDEFCRTWEEYEAGFAEGVRVRSLLENRSRGIGY